MSRIILFVLFITVQFSVLEAKESLTLGQLVPSQYTTVEYLGDVENHNLDEISGMAQSTLQPNILWMMNDSGGKKRLYAVGLDGKDFGVFTVDGVKNRDWEDLASFKHNGVSYLLIADVGDNRSDHKKSRLYIVKEPDLNSKHRFFMPVFSEIKFNYEDSPRDCESVAVDAVHEKILLISKRTVPPVLYELPLDIEPRVSEHVAKRVTEIPGIPLLTMEEIRQDPRFGPFGSQPTAMDISQDGRYAVVLTYQNAYLYPFKSDWKSTFSALPQLIPIPRLEQAESICFQMPDYNILICTEELPAPLYVLKK